VIENAGLLNKRIKLQRPVSSTSAYGESETTWVDVRYCWAEIIPQSGDEFEEQKRVNTSITHSVRIRYSADVDPTWRILFGSRVLQIVDVINTAESNEELVLGCEEHT